MRVCDWDRDSESEQRDKQAETQRNEARQLRAGERERNRATDTH